MRVTLPASWLAGWLFMLVLISTTWISEFALANTHLRQDHVDIDDHKILIPSQEIFETTASGAVTYFYLAVPEDNKSSIVILVNPQSVSNPDLYASPINSLPSKGDYSSATPGFDIITIPLEKLTTPQIYIGVQCQSSNTNDCDYSLVAHFRAPKPLEDGKISIDIVETGAISNYFLDITTLRKDFSTLTLSLANIQGISNFYVSPLSSSEPTVYPDPSDEASYKWAHQSGTGQPLTLSGGQLKDYEKIVISVISPDTTNLVKSTTIFTFVAFSDNTDTSLRRDEPLHAFATSKEPAFFNVDVPQRCELFVIVTPFTGNPDLYAGELPKPSRENHSKSSETDFFEVITYPKTDEDAKYYFAVEVPMTENAELSTSSFTIMAHLKCEGQTTSIVLADGQSQYGYTVAADVIYYNFHMPLHVNADKKPSLTCILDTFFGEASIYIVAVPQGSEPVVPDKDNAMWSSELPGVDTIVIDPLDEHYCTNCTYFIAVVVEEKAQYIMTAATTSSHTQLQIGTPFRGFVSGGQANYYLISWNRKRETLDSAAETLTIIVSALSGGNPDIYASKDPFPNSATAQWTSASYAGDVISIERREIDCFLTSDLEEPCSIYITIDSPTTNNIAYTVIGSDNGYFHLQDGITQTSIVGAKKTQQLVFRIDRPSRTKEINYVFAVKSGIADLYLSATTVPVPGDSSTYTNSILSVSSTSIANLVVPEDICPSSTNMWVPCYFFATVLGRSEDVQYALTATSKSQTTLRSGIPHRASLTLNQPNYYSFFIANNQNDVLIILTANSGDPDIFVSRTIIHPDVETAEWFSLQDGSDAVVISNAEKGMYFMSIVGHSSQDAHSDYSILVTEVGPNTNKDSVPLELGYPQSMVLSPQGTQVFHLDMSKKTEIDLGKTLSFMFATSFGSVVAYITDDDTLPPSKDNQKWSSESSNSNLVIIPDPLPAVYFIAIVEQKNTPALFSLTAAAESTSVILLDGIPVISRTLPEKFTFFEIKVDQPKKDLTIMATHLIGENGDCDIFVSDVLEDLKQAEPKPKWESNGYLEDVVTIAWDDSKKEKNCLDNDGQCTFYIGIYSSTGSSEFKILAHFSAQIALTDGSLVSGAVAEAEWKYYTFTVASPSAQRVSLSFDASVGIPYVFADVNKTPTEQGSKWKLTNVSMTGQVLVITNLDKDFCNGYVQEDPLDSDSPFIPSETPCVYKFGVLGKSPNRATYMMVASIGGEETTHIRLRESLAISGELNEDEQAYYAFTIVGQAIDGVTPGLGEPSNLDIIVSVTSLSGDADLYASFTELYPDSKNYEYSATQWGDDVLYIPNAPVGQLYIATHAADNEMASYTIMVSSIPTSGSRDPAKNILLRDSLPQVGFSLSSWVYYSIEIDKAASQLHIDLVSQTGDADIYVNLGTTRPTTKNSDYSSTNYGVWDTITIDDLPTLFPDATSYSVTIGIWTYGPTKFTITTTSDLFPRRVQQGIPIQAASNHDNSASYLFYEVEKTGKKDDLIFSLTTFFGNPRVYIATSDSYIKPDKENAEWEIEGRATMVFIPSSDVAAAHYFIGVHCVTSCSYSIIVSHGGRSRLIDAIPQEITARPSYPALLTFLVPSKKKDVVVEVSPSETKSYTLKISVNRDPLANETSKDADYFVSGSGKREILIPYYDLSERFGYRCVIYTNEDDSVKYNGLELPGASLPPCILSIALVSGISTSGISKFSITARSLASSLILRNAVPHRGIVSSDTPSYFTYRNNYEKASITVSVTPVTQGAFGDTSLFMSTAARYPGPDPELHTWKAESWNRNPILHADYTESGFATNGHFYISLRTLEEFEYSIVVTITPLDERSEAESRLLTPGYSEVGFINPAPPAFRGHYYRFHPSGSSRVTFSVTREYGDPDIFVNTNGVRPTESNSEHSSRQYGNDELVINDPCGVPVENEKPKDCWLDILVNANIKTLYSIVVQADDSVTKLSPGISISNSVVKEQTRFYSFATPSKLDKVHPLTVILSMKSGDSDLFVSSKIDYPTFASCVACQRATGEPCCHIGINAGGDQITVDDPTPDTTYNIGVTGETASAYSLVAHLNMVALISGQPQNGVLVGSQTVIYRFVAFIPEDQRRSLRLLLSQNAAVNSAEMYVVAVSNDDKTRPIPGPNNAMWSSLEPSPSGSAFQGEILIGQEDPKACFDCVYYIAVVGSEKSQTTSYSLTVIPSDEMVSLLAGRPHRSSVRTGSTLYFKAIVANDEQISFGLDVSFGSGMMYISTTETKPSAEKNSYHGKHVHISAEDVKAGVYYIAVEGLRDTTVASTTFVITYSSQVIFVNLGDQITVASNPTGNLFEFIVGAKENMYIDLTPTANSAGVQFEAYVTNEVDNDDYDAGSFVEKRVDTFAAQKTNALKFGLHRFLNSVIDKSEYGNAVIETLGSEEQLGGVMPIYDVFVTSNPTNPRPTADSAKDDARQWSFRTTYKTGYSILLSPTDPRFCTGCIYHMNIIPVDGTTIDNPNYTIYLSSGSTVVTLSDNLTVESQADLRSSVFFAIPASNTKDVTLLVENCLGISNVYVSYQSFRPNRHNANYVVENIPTVSRVELLGSGSGRAENNMYTVGVYGALASRPPQPQHTVFRITAFTDYTDPVAEFDKQITSSTPKPFYVRVSAAVAKFSLASYEPMEVAYYVYYSLSSDYVVMGTMCGMQRGPTQHVGPFYLTSSDQETIDVEINGLRGNKSYSFNFVAVEPTTDSAAVYNHIPSVLILASVEPSNLVKLIFLIVVPLCLILLIVVFCLYRKNRKLTSQLDVEMSDLPKNAMVKAINGPRGSDIQEDVVTTAHSFKKDRGHNKYTKLVDEDDNSYMPPSDL